MDFIALQTALAGQYFLERELGRGGMGVVYLAREVRLDRPVAIKVLPPALSAQPELRERFLREARTAARLSHPHIVPIHRVDEAGPFVYLAMGYVDGGTLADRLRARGGTLTPAEVVRLVREVGWALAYAHARGVVHRDVKPDNILLDRETARALVTDFGIAQVADAGVGQEPITAEGRVLGTAHYMSPEQAAGEPLDGRSDLYALGVVAYQALAGRLPFDAPTVHALLAKHLTQAPPPLVGVPPRLARVVMQCLAKAPADRPATGEALAELVGEAAADERPLPPALREWAEARDPLLALYGVWSGACVTIAVAMFQVGTMFGRRTAMNWDELRFVLLAALPLIPHAVFRLRLTWRALAAGHDVEDLRGALARQLERERREPTEPRALVPPALVRPMAALVYVVIAAALAAVGLAPTVQRFVPALRGVSPMPIVLLAIALGALGSALGVTWPGRPLRGALLGRVRLGFLRSRAGERFTGWLGRRARRGAPAGATDVVRPTEHVIGLAAADLLAALPDPTRRALGELPELLRALEREADAMRERARSLDERAARAADGAPVGALLDAREDAERRRETAVAALEAIRLDLLRLQADAAQPSTLTALVERARRLGEHVDALAETPTPRDDDGARTVPTRDARVSTPI